jgi:hypothetical protein
VWEIAQKRKSFSGGKSKVKSIKTLILLILFTINSQNTWPCAPINCCTDTHKKTGKAFGFTCSYDL